MELILLLSLVPFFFSLFCGYKTGPHINRILHPRLKVVIDETRMNGGMLESCKGVVLISDSAHNSSGDSLRYVILTMP